MIADLQDQGPAIGRGYCQCGCGERTKQVSRDDPARGMKAGDFNRFVHGKHYHDLVRKSKPGWGKQNQRTQRREEIRSEITRTAGENPSLTKEDIATQYADEGFTLHQRRNRCHAGTAPDRPDVTPSVSDATTAQAATQGAPMSDCDHIIGEVQKFEEDRDWHNYLVEKSAINVIIADCRYRDFLRTYGEPWRFCPKCGEDISAISNALKRDIDALPKFT